eukprot:TRINITY_DN56607_c0_g1_i1.p1 TRINITY_DN56607_c0_g1~~TRINITY_DN56607_c0_g1_i1.p1  ORF type:complete len:391 (-),score=44.36 TRINITY_DN56607_c0_g1_i1:24-1196(-)
MVTADAVSVSPEELQVAIHVLRCAVPHRETAEAAALRAQLLPHLNPLLRREKQVAKAAKAKAEHGKENKANDTASGLTNFIARSDASLAVKSDGTAELGTSEDRASAAVIDIPAALLSRPLYPNPVCFLTTWLPECRHDGVLPRNNVMTISWLTALDNDGTFVCSMNQRRHTATMLQRNPWFVLNVAVAGLESLLRRVGGCHGSKGNKASALGVELCRPGWVPIPRKESIATGDGNDLDGTVDFGNGASISVSALGCEVNGSTKSESTREMPLASLDESGCEPAWPLDGDLELPQLSTQAVETDRSLSAAVAVTRCVAHVLAKVERVRGTHGHFLLTCKTYRAYVLKEYWSGKTLRPERADLPPILAFLGSQQFGRVFVTDEAPARSCDI